MCFRFGSCSSLKRSKSESLFFKPKMISTNIVYGCLDIKRNNVPVHDKPYLRCILNQINKTYTCTCLGYEFCLKQYDNVTRESYFFQPLSTCLRLNKTLDVTVFFFFFFFITSFYFSLGTVLMFTSEVIYSIPYPYQEHYNTKIYF